VAHARLRVPSSLILWIAAACVLFLMAPRPPEPPPMTLEERLAQQRAADFIVRDAQQWQARRGDLIVPWDEAEGHLAIVIDDVGRELHLLDKLLALRFRISFAVLPGSIYAAGAQLRLRDDRRRYREILLHLPMEPLDAAQMFEGAEARETFLLHTDDPQVLRAKLDAALRRVPAATGVNNHMGSSLTTNREAMDVVMAELRERGLYFVDSRTNADSQASLAAASAGVRTAAREVFLDNEVSEDAIEAQLLRAANLAREHPVIAIGHPSAELHAVLERELPELHEAGIGVYPVSRLLRP
jgi:polysaccharide deacetylase 2 family uncharacterized protein YibQ